MASLVVLGTEQLPSLCNLPCGVAAGILASGITQPADVVKTKLQTKLAQNTTSQVFRDIVKVNVLTQCANALVNVILMIE